MDFLSYATFMHRFSCTINCVETAITEFVWFWFVMLQSTMGKYVYSAHAQRSVTSRKKITTKNTVKTKKSNCDELIRVL